MVSKYLLQTNIWVAICFTALVVFFQLNLYEPKYSVWGIAFFGTLGIYNFTRIGNLEKIRNPSNRMQLILTLIGVLGALICVILRGFELKTFLYLGVLGFVSFCYSLPFKGLGLRTIPFLKLFLIAFVWTGSSIGLLLIVHDAFNLHDKLFLSVFLFVIGITLPFDIRDSQIDDTELKTIPQIIGIKASKILAIVCLLFSAALFYSEYPIFNSFVVSWWITCFVSILFCLNSSQQKSPFYYAFWMESCSLFPILFTIILNYFKL
jgi:4-hydroxybenzoate polyprenyltransferase